MISAQMTQDPVSNDEISGEALTRKDLLDEKRNVTVKISDSCRFIAFGLLAVYYTIMASAEPFAGGVKQIGGHYN